MNKLRASSVAAFAFSLPCLSIAAFLLFVGFNGYSAGSGNDGNSFFRICPTGNAGASCTEFGWFTLSGALALASVLAAFFIYVGIRLWQRANLNA